MQYQFSSRKFDKCHLPYNLCPQDCVDEVLVVGPSLHTKLRSLFRLDRRNLCEPATKQNFHLITTSSSTNVTPKYIQREC